MRRAAIACVAWAAVAAFGVARAAAQEPLRFSGAPCTTPPALHCPDKDCPPDRIINQGSVVEMKTRRTYFLDYPCDLKAGEPVIFILSLHGAGSIGNWQRHYFPLLDYKDTYRLVIATPNSPTRIWSEVDDGYLQNIVESVVEQIGKAHIRSFWLVGHSQGGLTSNRLLRTDFFKDRVDGFLSLSGGRLGGSPGRGNFGAIGGGAPPGGGRGGAGVAGAAAALRELPAANFSFVFATGEREMDEKGLPDASAWASRLGCGARKPGDEIVDAKAGYIFDTSRQNPPNPAWGLVARPGRARIYVYPGCADGRIVADVVRFEKGHTEGLEPNVTDALVKTMAAAKGGKIQQLR